MKERHLARSFNLTFRYIDVALSLNNPRFGDYLRRICPKRTWIKGLPRILTYYSKWLITKLYDKHDDVLFRIINFPLVCGNALSATEGITSKVLRSSYWICWQICCVHLYRCTWSLLPFLEESRVAHVLLILCVFSSISYVLLVVFVSVFIASSLSLDSWVLNFALTVITLVFTFT